MSLKKGIFELHSSAFATSTCTLINVSHLTEGYCWSCMDPPPMSRRNHSDNILVQIHSCIRPLKAGFLGPAGPDAVGASPPDHPLGLRSPDQHQSLGKP